MHGPVCLLFWKMSNSHFGAQRTLPAHACADVLPLLAHTACSYERSSAYIGRALRM
jgi:hypothetical protein